MSSDGHSNYESTNGGPLPPLSLSILGVEPLDEFIKEVADFVHHHISNRPDLPGHIEVEAKIGLLKQKGADDRLKIDILGEAILPTHRSDYHFDSNMSMHQHKHYNTLLNRLMTQPATRHSTPLKYNHLRLIDNFFTPEDGRRDKIRVTRNEADGQVLQSIHKMRLGNLDIYSPKNSADWRVSVNFEHHVPHPVGSPTKTRRKDRLSYSHEEFSIDLTQVTSTGFTPQTQITWELELEIARSELLISTAHMRRNSSYSEAEQSAFDELIRAFVNNARILVRNAAPENQH